MVRVIPDFVFARRVDGLVGEPYFLIATLDLQNWSPGPDARRRME